MDVFDETQAKPAVPPPPPIAAQPPPPPPVEPQADPFADTQGSGPTPPVSAAPEASPDATAVAADPFIDSQGGPAPASPVTPQPPVGVEDIGVGSELLHGVERGFQQQMTATGLAQYMIGTTDIDSVTDAVVANEKAIRTTTMSPGLLKSEQEFAATKGWWDSAGFLLSHPRMSLTMAAESAPTMVPSALGAIVGGAAGSLAGPVGAGVGAKLGQGVGSGYAEYGNSIMDYMRQHGVDATDPNSVRALLSNPQFLDEANAYALKRGASIGAIDVVGAHFGGKVAGRFDVPGAGFGSRAGGMAAGTGLDAFTEGGGEALAELTSTGQIDPKQVVAEAYLSLATSLPDVAIPIMIEKGVASLQRGGPVTVENVADIMRKAGSDIVLMPEGNVDEDSTILLGPELEPGAPEPKGREQEPRAPIGKPREGEDPGSPVTPQKPKLKLDFDEFSEAVRTAKFDQNTPAGWGDYLVASTNLQGSQVPRLPAWIMKGDGNISKGDILAYVDSRRMVGAGTAGYQANAIATGQIFELRERTSNVTMAEISLLDSFAPGLGKVLILNSVSTRAGTRIRDAAIMYAMRLAADLGFDHLAVNTARPDPDPQAERSGYVPSGMITAKVRELAERAGGTASTVDLLPGDDLPVVTISPQFRTTVPVDAPVVQTGTGKVSVVIEHQPVSQSTTTMAGPSASTGGPTAGPTVGAAVHSDAVKALLPAAKRAGAIIKEFAKQFGIKGNITIILTTRINGIGYAKTMADGNHVIEVSVQKANGKPYGAPQLFGIMIHEFGHIVSIEKYRTASPDIKLGIDAAYDDWYQSTDPMSLRMSRLLLRRNNVIATFYRLYRGGLGADYHGWAIDYPTVSSYWASKEEWFAEQVARWATSSEKPIGVIEGYFASLGRLIVRLGRLLSKRFGLSFEAEPFVQQWLDSFITTAGPFARDIAAENMATTKVMNKRALKRSGARWVDATPMTPATIAMRELGNRIWKGNPPPEFLAGAASADRMNWFYKIMLSVVQVAKRNLHIRELQLYKEDIASAQLERVGIMDSALKVLKAWHGLGTEQSDRLTDFIDDYMNMRYLSSAEVAKKVTRKPTADELTAMIAHHQLGNNAVITFKMITDSFNDMLMRYKAQLVQEANKIADPTKSAAALANIDAQIQRMGKAPYFPAMRFGDYIVTVRGPQGNVVHVEFHASQAKQQRAARALQRGFGPDHNVILNVMPKSAKPLMGVPPGLINMIAEKLQLDPDQRSVLDELRFELSPAQSFRHRFQRKNKTPGYSRDFVRSYANYFFHGANHFTRVKYADQLNGHIKAIRAQAKAIAFPQSGNKRGDIANMLDEHLKEWLNPKPDFLLLRGIIFHYAFGFNPAAAALNLSQMLVTTMPYLASRYGDVKATSAMTRAGADVSTYYRKGTLENTTDEELEAISEAVKSGIVTEAMAPEIAGVAEGRNIMGGFGGNEWERLIHGTAKLSAGMFQLAEQMNRRVTFRAAWKLAKENPGSAYFKELLQSNERQYTTLRDRGWTHENAMAFVAAKDAVETTQFIYSAYAQPKFVRGKLKTLFVFKMFTQNMLFFLWHHKPAAARSLLVMGALGGLLGLPGAQDIGDVLKAIAYRLFGKDFDLERAARDLVLKITDGTVDPDILLHGISRMSYGIPAILDALGGTVGMDIPFPVTDQSASIGLGRISPIPLGTAWGPTNDTDATIAQTLQKSSGAVYGLAFNVYRFLQDLAAPGKWKDLKTWERILPRSLVSISRGYEALTSGVSTTARGDPIATFDPHDTEQMMEIGAMALGYTPTRISQQWDRIKAFQEIKMFYQVTRNGLLDQIDAAKRNKDKEGYAGAMQAIKEWNSTLPDFAKGMRITRETLINSLTERQKNRKLRAQGRSPFKQDRPITQEINRLYPGAEEVGSKAVR
jgi:hypothetical protein